MPVSRTIEILPTLDEARMRILDLAEPGRPIEVSLADALGLVLAGPAVADVDHPASDRASCEGYAVRASEATAGALLRVAVPSGPGRPADEAIEAGEAIRVARGQGLPAGADAVIRLDEARPDPEAGLARVLEILDAPEPGRNVARRGHLIGSGDEIAPAGARLRPSMVGLLASQGCVHPLCHRRVRVSVLAVGDHLVGPSEPPVMHRERNAANAAIVSLALRAGAMPHDLQAVPESGFDAAFERSTSAPLIVVLGPASTPVRRVFRGFGVEPVVDLVALSPGGRARHGVIRDDAGRVAHHVFRLPLAPVAASTAFALLVQPLIARLQGGPAGPPPSTVATWDGDHAATGSRLRAVPVALGIDEEGRQRARPIPLRGLDDLRSFARADALALLPPRSGPWTGGERVEVLRLD